MNKENILRNLPSVNDLAVEIKNSSGDEYSFNLIVECSREVLNSIRQDVRKGKEFLTAEGFIAEKVKDLLKRKSLNSLRRVINATGIILHTNLGRALLGEKAQNAVRDILYGYSNLEVNLETGKRGSRYSHVEGLLTRITGAEGALVVNNNAAAVFLILQALARGKEVIVSRGQLVEIGGSFRVPEILAASGARLVEVGTTNKTRAADYERAITEETALLLKVHTSNYRILGFTEDVSIEELSSLGSKYGIPVVEDLGSGFLVSLKQFGITDEPTVQESVAGGADIVSFSGDKLLGGPQAGIIIGKEKYINIIKKNPLNRALRVDKMTIAALEATLREYIYEENVVDTNPTLRMLTISQEALKLKAEGLMEAMNSKLGSLTEISIIENYSEAGGGSLPTTRLSTWAVALKPYKGSANGLVEKLRMGVPAILARIEDDRILFDVRTIQESEFNIICSRLFEEISRE
ncbi:L-seryl-tRNA(Sec) selenium transferase [Desulfitibacter alkalitolerans]|uniref:L-seryl-tRNA(Sec) selenium transferase n=1 Tax=Desulfitibacter alkalitolerans TaxID=264641 RepID=UPI0004812F8F|nr:L-seryl-tRNA(Sec) selenium transferase [Desulfitibacter alkalitolerans]